MKVPLSTQFWRVGGLDSPANSKKRNADVENTTAVSSVCEIADHDGHTGSNEVWRNSEQLANSVAISEAIDDRRQEERECVKRHVSSHIDEHTQPSFIVCYGLFEETKLHLLTSSRRLLVLPKPPNDSNPFFI
jgi:hypothetical protein